MKKMDYTIGLEAGRAGQKWTATALTDRAKKRTPEPVRFVDRPEALKFLKDSQSEGYRLSGAGLLDPEQRLVKNRYFVVGADGELTLSGEDNGPRDTVWEIGDVMPGRDRSTGTEAVVENILQGFAVRERFGCDLAFVLRLHRVAGGPLAVPPIPPFDPAKPCPCGLHGKSYGSCCRDKGIHASGNEMLRGTAPRLVSGALSQIQSSMVQGDTRFRIVWNKVWHYPQHETFHQFLDALVVGTLGKEWFEEQLLLPLKNQNAIVRWRTAMVELLRRPGDADDGVSTGHTLTGPAKAYQCFGYDLYWLQLVHKLPDSVIERLKDFGAFQGARYEVLIAAIFARAGFEVEWIDDNKASGKHPEFIATHKVTGKKVGVETKSRQRPGAMNYIGTVSPETHLKGDREGVSMRLQILDSGHDFGTKALFALIRTVSRQPVLDVIKLVKYRADFYGGPMQGVTHEAMRGPSTWSVGDRELMAAFVAKTNQCEFCTKAHAAVAQRAYRNGKTVSALCMRVQGHICQLFLKRHRRIGRCHRS